MTFSHKSTAIKKCRICWPVLAGLILFVTMVFSYPAFADSDRPDLTGATVKGARAWSATFGASYDSDLGNTYIWQSCVHHYFFDHIAFSYGALIGYANPVRTKAGVFGGPQIGLRWHVLRGERWSFDVEGMAAAVVHQHPWPIRHETKNEMK